ncbi:zinc knuckle [Ostertagia ostertagi]
MEEELGRLHRKYRSNPSRAGTLVRCVMGTLAERGIETEEDWKEYVATMERDGEIIAASIKEYVASLLKNGEENKAPGMSFGIDPVDYDHARRYNESLQGNRCPTGATYVDNWSLPSSVTVAMREDTGMDVNTHLVNYLRAMTCADPDILADDHLGGRAKNVFMSLPRVIREQGFEAVTSEMAKLLACDSTASRMRALTELRNLRIRPGQDVAEFCVVLEKLGRQANPESSLEDRSMEYAQILLDNLSSWPEHFQLVGALHKVEPRRAYDELKSLALSIEQSKLILAAQRKDPLPAWRTRSAQYLGNRDARVANAGTATEERNISREVRQKGLSGDTSRTGGTTRRELQEPMSRSLTESRKCYRCSKYGHVARDCPLRAARVNTIEPKDMAPSQKDETLASIVSRARCMGLAVKASSANDLIGNRVTVPLNILGEKCQALIDTGSMISIVPVKILAEIQDKGFDLDSLVMVPRTKLKPVFDASDNRMDFLAGVYIQVKLEQGTTQEVAFHISPKKESDIILGTNALPRLGISISIEKERDSLRK